ncbi:hypothetical protein [Acidovorax sp. MR-S7]|uniref:hypothetical protein n=1 Tax=Acidovorax sp. MR-S7 TaxID=1268622 RepID=UPI00036F0B7C|nr:hypothetical protein [Acidovorax sp. MR-S7]GAD20968.1 hypothetical protein AVS7_00729 [Acidovorax sp. MR-S7]
MQYIKLTFIDAVTGIPVTQEPAANGPVLPPVQGLVVEWERESAYPTDQPELFGTCPDESDTDLAGVLAVMTQAEWDAEHQAELAAREAKDRHLWQITRLAFRNRFTLPEKAGLELASVDDASAPMVQRQQAALLRAYLADVAAATFIDLKRPDTRAGVEQLEALGLLAAGRAAEILDAPIRPEEAP